MIRSFRDKRTSAIFERRFSTRLPRGIQPAAYRKLVQLDAATRLDDLRVPPGNRLKSLSGKRAGQHSIRINEWWRICFMWRARDAYNVEIVDYH